MKPEIGDDNHNSAGKEGLPSTVTSIRPQKNRRGRFSLYSEKGFIIGVSTDTLVKYNLGKGVEITPFLFEQISGEEGRQTIKDYCLRLLGRREHAREELKRKAADKGFDPGQVEPVLDELARKKYIDDEKFAEKFVSDKIGIQRWGPVKIRAELKKKRISNPVIDRTISIYTDDLELIQICVDLALKRKRHFSKEPDAFKCKQKIAAYLQRKGFSFETINRALPDIIRSLNV